jgi:hypothetical protein
MPQTEIEFTSGDLVEISQYLAAMSVAEHERSGSGGRALALLYLRLADELAAQWLALDEGREASPVVVPSDALVDVAQGALEEALRRLDEMQAHQEEHRPADEPWRFVIALLRGHVGAELETRGAETN